MLEAPTPPDALTGEVPLPLPAASSHARLPSPERSGEPRGRHVASEASTAEGDPNPNPPFVATAPMPMPALSMARRAANSCSARVASSERCRRARAVPRPGGLAAMGDGSVRAGEGTPTRTGAVVRHAWEPPGVETRRSCRDGPRARDGDDTDAPPATPASISEWCSTDVPSGTLMSPRKVTTVEASGPPARMLCPSSPTNPWPRLARGPCRAPCPPRCALNEDSVSAPADVQCPARDAPRKSPVSTPPGGLPAGRAGGTGLRGGGTGLRGGGTGRASLAAEGGLPSGDAIGASPAARGATTPALGSAGGAARGARVSSRPGVRRDRCVGDPSPLACGISRAGAGTPRTLWRSKRSPRQQQLVLDVLCTHGFETHSGHVHPLRDLRGPVPHRPRRAIEPPRGGPMLRHGSCGNGEAVGSTAAGLMVRTGLGTGVGVDICARIGRQMQKKASAACAEEKQARGGLGMGHGCSRRKTAARAPAPAARLMKGRSAP